MLLFLPYTVLSQSVLLGLRFIHNSVFSPGLLPHKSLRLNRLTQLGVPCQAKGGTSTVEMPHWMAPWYQQNQQTTAPCLPKLFASCWENVTSSKPVIAANLSRDYNRMSTKDCPHHNQQVPRPTPVSPVAKLPVSTFIINSDSRFGSPQDSL